MLIIERTRANLMALVLDALKGAGHDLKTLPLRR
jgi:hypothetical protein